MQDLIIFLSDPSLVISKSDLSILGMLCGLVMDNKINTLPAWLSIRNKDVLVQPKDWNIHLEHGKEKQAIVIPSNKSHNPQQLKLF